MRVAEDAKAKKRAKECDDETGIQLGTERWTDQHSALAEKCYLAEKCVTLTMLDYQIHFIQFHVPSEFLGVPCVN